MTCRVRFSAAILALAAMLFASIATAMEACEPMAQVPVAAGTASTSPHGGFDNPDCERHCNGAARSGDLAKTLPAAHAVLAPPQAMQRPFDRAILLRGATPSLPAYRYDPSPPLTRFTILRL